MAEIETQARRFDYASGLLHMRPKHLAQRRMQQVCRRVIALGGEPFAGRNLCPEFVSHGDVRERPDLVDCEAGNRRIRVEDSGDLLTGIRVDEPAVVAHLTASFGVERSLVQNDFRVDSGGEHVHGFLFHEQAHGFRRGIQL